MTRERGAEEERERERREREGKGERERERERDGLRMNKLWERILNGRKKVTCKER